MLIERLEEASVIRLPKQRGQTHKERTVWLKYQGGVGVMIGEPHKEGMNPALFRPVIDFLRG